MNRNALERTRRLALLTVVTLGVCSWPFLFSSAQTAPAPAIALEQECAEAQRLVAGTARPVVNLSYVDFDEFVLSKAQIEPLTSQQFVWYADAERRHPKRISCKLKTADHILTHYGAGAASAESTCQAANVSIVDRVFAQLTDEERGRLKFARERVVVEADEMAATGPDWLEPYFYVSLATDTVRIKPRGFRADWNDPRLAQAPPRFKGTHYCHLIAPQYVKRIVLGDVNLR
jgi:hypothetical protein